jgi:hypothetical protein
MPMKFVDIAGRGSGRPYFESLVFHIGPETGAAAWLETTDRWLKKRMRHGQKLLSCAGGARPPIAAILEEVADRPLEILFAGMTTGGMRGIVCPNLRIDVLESRFRCGGALFPVLKARPDLQLALCARIGQALDARWIVGWLVGNFCNRQSVYEVGGSR